MQIFAAVHTIRKAIHLNIFVIMTLLLFPGISSSQTILEQAEAAAQNNSSHATKWTGHFNYIFGYKGMDDNWSPAENQFEFGIVDFDFRKIDWPVSIAVQILMTYSDQEPDAPMVYGDFSGTYEFNLGLRKIWRPKDKIQPFLGGGLSIVGASATKQVYDNCYYQTDNDSGLGYWIGTGAYWNITNTFHTGINLQYTYGEIQFFEKDFNAGGLHVNAIVGLHW